MAACWREHLAHDSSGLDVRAPVELWVLWLTQIQRARQERAITRESIEPLQALSEAAVLPHGTFPWPVDNHLRKRLIDH